MKLKKYKLGELLDIKRGTSLSGDFYDTTGTYIRLTCGNFDYQNNCFKENKSKDNLFYTGKFKHEFLMKQGDIITPLTEQAVGLLGSTAIVPESGKYIQSQDIAKVTCKDGLLDNNFAFYLMSSNIVKQQLSSGAQQTKIRHTSPDKIKDCTVWIPSLTEQKLIGNFLKSIDRKIELNKSINQNLEAMAKLLYEYWFVQFDFPDENGKPYKSSGGKMVWCEELKKEIPKCWELGEINDIIKLEDNKRIPLSSKERQNKKGIYPYYGATGVMDHINEYLFDTDRILMAEDGSTSDKKGFPIIQYAWGKYWVNNHAHVISSKNPSHLLYIYHLLKNTPAKNIETGSIQKKINQKNLLNYQIVIPHQILIDRYCETILPIFECYKLTKDEIKNLNKLRDELLPMLMSGQVSVNSDL